MATDSENPRCQNRFCCCWAAFRIQFPRLAEPIRRNKQGELGFCALYPCGWPRGRTATCPQTSLCCTPRWLLCGQDICIVIIIITRLSVRPICSWPRSRPIYLFLRPLLASGSLSSSPVERTLLPGANWKNTQCAPMMGSDLDVHVTKSRLNEGAFIKKRDVPWCSLIITWWCREKLVVMRASTFSLMAYMSCVEYGVYCVFN